MFMTDETNNVNICLVVKYDTAWVGVWLWSAPVA